MGREVNLFLDQLDMHCHGSEWFVSMDNALEGITAKEASWTNSGGNTIWQIVNHLIFWNEDVIHRIKGTVNPKKAENNDATFGEPGDQENEVKWEQTLLRLRTVMVELKATIAGIDDDALDSSYRPNSYSIRRLLSNIMMHDTYHLGQIVLLRKLQSTWPGVDWS